MGKHALLGWQPGYFEIFNFAFPSNLIGIWTFPIFENSAITHSTGDPTWLNSWLNNPVLDEHDARSPALQAYRPKYYRTHQAAPPPAIAAVFSLFHLWNNVMMMKATPVEANPMANEIFSPRMYATKIPGTWFAEKSFRSSVAPVNTTVAGSTPGAEWGRTLTSTLTRAACAAEIMKAPPIVWKKRRMAITSARSAAGAVAWTVMIGIWDAIPQPTPPMI